MERWQGDAFLQDSSVILTYNYNENYLIATLHPEEQFMTKQSLDVRKLGWRCKQMEELSLALQMGTLFAKFPYFFLNVISTEMEVVILLEFNILFLLCFCACLL